MGRSDFTLGELKTAFELRIVHMVMTADEVVTATETEFLESVFPPEELDAHGFLDRDENRFTRRFGKAVQAAPDALSQWLAADEKLDMIRLFFKASEVDGDVDPRELSVIVQAARMLGLTQEELVPHLSRLVGSRNVTRTAPPVTTLRPSADALVTTLDGLQAAFDNDPTDTALVLKQRLDAVLRNDDAQLTVIVTTADAQSGRTHGLDTLIGFCAHHGTLLLLAGRVTLAFDRWEGEQRLPSEVPQLRSWMKTLVTTYPWLPAWLVQHDGVAGQLVASCVPVDVKDPDYPTFFIALAVEAANWAVALTRSLGGSNLDHVYEYLAELGMGDLPPGYFEGVEALAGRLDVDARALPQAVGGQL